MYKEVSGSAIVFLVLYVDDILLIENDVPIFKSSQRLVIQNVLHERHRRSNLILGNKDL